MPKIVTQSAFSQFANLHGHSSSQSAVLGQQVACIGRHAAHENLNLPRLVALRNLSEIW